MIIASFVFSILAISFAVYSVYLTHPKKIKSIYPDVPPYYVNRFTGERIGHHRVNKD